MYDDAQGADPCRRPLKSVDILSIWHELRPRSIAVSARRPLSAQPASGIAARKEATRSRTSSRTGLSVCPRRGYVTSSPCASSGDGGPQQVDPRERVRLAREQQHRAGDRRPVGDPRLRPLGRAGRVERVAEQTSPAYGAPGSAAARLATRPPYECPPTATSGTDGTAAWNAGERVLGPALRQVDGPCVEPTRPQPVDERRHAGRRPARAVSQEATRRLTDTG